MRFRVDVDLMDKGVTLPLNYQKLIQGILYHALPRELAEEAHQQEPGIRKLPQFTFSRLFGHDGIDLKRRLIHFPRLYFEVSTHRDSIAYYMMTILSKGIRFFEEDFSTKLTILENYRGGHDIELLSPVTVRRTDPVTKKSVYFEPNTLDFNAAIYRNLQTKYRLYFGEEYQGPFAITAKPESLKSSNILYKNTYIKGYVGLFQLVASPKAMHLLYDIGLGEKNAQGFGMFRMEEKKHV